MGRVSFTTQPSSLHVLHISYYTGIIGLVVALNACVHVSAYGFVLNNDASYYDDRCSTMWAGWRGDGVVELLQWSTSAQDRPGPGVDSCAAQRADEPDYFPTHHTSAHYGGRP